MKWGRVQKLTEALLAGDGVLIQDAEGRIALLQYAYEEIANLTEVLSLETTDATVDKVRESVNGTVIRRPGIPTDNNDELQVDEGLCFVVARLIASYISREKYGLHRKQALDMIEVYNRKVYSYRDGHATSYFGNEKTFIPEG